MGRAPWQPLYEYFILCTTCHGIGMIHENTEPPLCSVVMNGLVLQYKFADDKVPRTDPSDRYASAAESNSITTDSSSTQLLCYLRHYWVHSITNCPQLDTPTTPSAPSLRVIHTVIIGYVTYLDFFFNVCCLHPFWTIQLSFVNTILLG